MFPKKILFLFFILFSQTLYSQTFTSEKVIKYKIDGSSISIVDSVGEINPSEGNSYYYSAAVTNTGSYLFHYRRSTYSPQYAKEELKVFDENAKQFYTFRDVIFPDEEISAPYLMHRPFTEQAANGKWIIHGEYGNFYASNEGGFHFINKAADNTDSLRLYSIPGKVGDKYLVSVEDKNQQYHYLYYLCDISSPDISITGTAQITFEDNSIPLRLKLLKDNYYIVHAVSSDGSRKLSIYQYTDNKFKFFMKVTDYGDQYFSFDSKWNILNNTFYLVDNSELKSYVLNSTGTGFIKTVLFDSITEENFAVDSDFKIAAYIKDNFLKVYHISDMQVIDSISLSGINGASRPIVDSPYVYVHQFSTTTDVEEKSSIAVKEFNLSAFPNPFNPVTTISFNLPYAQETEVRIYNLLGKEIAVLVNEFLCAGNHNIKFNAGNLPSGVYLYKLIGKNFSDTKKLILIK